MARGKTFQVRLSDEELAQAEAGAAAGGYENVSQFIRACIKRGGPTLGIQPGETTSSGGNVTIKATCLAAQHHRAGVYCKHCGVTP